MTFAQGLALLAEIRRDVKGFEGMDNQLKVMFESGEAEKIIDELTRVRVCAELTARRCSALLQIILDEPH